MVSSQDKVNTRPLTLAKIQAVPPNPESGVLPTICRVCVAQEGKPDDIAEGGCC